MDSRFKTARGIGAGSSFGQLRKTEKQLSFVSGEGSIGASAKDLSMTFSPAKDSATERHLFDRHSQHQGPDDLSKIPAETKTRSVWVH